ncbi:MAG: cation diffusion facilitator family transporter [Methylocystis sp.]
MTSAEKLELSDPSRKLGAARASIAASALLACAKLAAGLWSGSLSLLSEAGHAAVDTGATLLTFYAVREADKPADAEHHYGHGKFESLAALVETGLLFGLALFVVEEATRRLYEPSPSVDASWPVFAVLGVSILVDFVRSGQLSKIAKAEGSDALAADALHFASDLVSSVLVAVGLAATRLGFVHADALAAFGVALFIAVAGYRLGQRTIETLLDTAPRELVPRLQKIIGEVPGVIELESLRLRTVGQRVMGEASIAVSRSLRVEQAARIKDAVAAAIEAHAPQALITLTTEPRALDDETVIERILLVAARRHLPVHHIVAQQIEDRLSISLDLELDAAMPLWRAHEIATGFETAVEDEFGAYIEIETHIEPLEPRILLGREADPAMRRAIEESLARHAAAQDRVRDVHDVRVRGTADGLVVNYHCRLDDQLTVEAAHEAVDAIERRLREEFPTILRVAGHSEPSEG